MINGFLFLWCNFFAARVGPRMARRHVGTELVGQDARCAAARLKRFHARAAIKRLTAKI
jgi:hypothetical protein